MEMTLRGNWELLLYKGLGSKYSRGLFFLIQYQKETRHPVRLFTKHGQLSPYVCNLAEMEGLEPSTDGFGDHYSTN